MANYIPNTNSEIELMLNTLGISSLDELYRGIPDELKCDRKLLAGGLSEQEIQDLFHNLAKQNKSYSCIFAGGGSYNHYIPAVVKNLQERNEFITAYTPYQAEISQGILQAIFEYQSMICALTGMEVSNASHYSGATSAAEGVLMCADKGKVVTFDNINPDTLAVIKTYLWARGVELEVLKAEDGKAVLKDDLSGVACIYFEYTNYLGLIEDAKAIIEKAHAQKVKVVMGCNPIALALLKTPGELGADVAVGDGQPLGLPISFGGPYVGFMATTKKLMRKLPGRIVGQTVTSKGEKAYVLTLQAREQHIRREKASSNICSNQSLCAMINGMYLSAVGPQGLKEVATTCVSNAHYLANEFKSQGIKLAYSGEFFHEFVTVTPGKAAAIVEKLGLKNILGGIVLDQDRILWCCTEQVTKKDMDNVITTVGGVL